MRKKGKKFRITGITLRQIWLSLLLLFLSTFTCGMHQPNNPLANKSRKSYYVDSVSGNDSHDGLSPQTAWKTLSKASSQAYGPGDRLLLRRGARFNGTLLLQATGSAQLPVIVDTYDHGDGINAKPIIDAAGYEAGVHITNGSYVEINNLEIVSDGGTNIEKQALKQRYGVLVEAEKPGIYQHIHVANLDIHAIFATESVPANGKNPTSNKGMGIGILAKSEEAKLMDIVIKDCNIGLTGFTGIKISGKSFDPEFFVQEVRILNNKLRFIGGPGIQPGRCRDVIVRGNTVDHSGSSVDPRMHGRGSGIWPWTCHNVLIEKNRFMHARGKADSDGMHIDYNCKDVVIQYNISMDNEGGFIEILRNNYNCCYRYNLSINDGFRVKGQNGAKQDSRILWLSGYFGNKKPKKGPFNSYIYNNTIYTKKDSRSCFSIMSTAEGVLIANNIFYIQGNTLNTSGNDNSGTKIPGVVFKNNLYLNASIIPKDFPIQDSAPIYGDPQFRNPGGSNPADYIPRNVDLAKDRGIPIETIPGDNIGLKIGLSVEYDLLGKPVEGLPDIGAFEL